MYSLFAGAFSQQTFTMCETRGGITAVTSSQLALYLARLAVIDDQLRDDELHLLRLVPLAWLKEEPELCFTNIRTEFGPVSLRARLADSGRALQLSYTHEFVVPPKRVLLHVPPLGGLVRIVLNGEKLKWNLTQPVIVLA
jgi:hypothetical protein